MRRPTTPSPPRRLEQLKSRALKRPGVARAGFTTTDEGQWARKLWLSKDARAPLADIEEQSGGCPVVYDEEPESLPVARPAYPRLGG